VNGRNEHNQPTNAVNQKNSQRKSTKKTKNNLLAKYYQKNTKKINNCGGYYENIDRYE